MRVNQAIVFSTLAFVVISTSPGDETIIDVRRQLGNPNVSHMIPFGEKAFLICERGGEISRISACSLSFEKTVELLSYKGIAILEDSIYDNRNLKVLVSISSLSRPRFRRGENSNLTMLKLVEVSDIPYQVLKEDVVSRDPIFNAHFLAKNCALLVAKDRLGIWHVEDPQGVAWQDGGLNSSFLSVAGALSEIVKEEGASDARLRFEKLSKGLVIATNGNGGFITAEKSNDSTSKLVMQTANSLQVHSMDKIVVAVAVAKGDRFGIAYLNQVGEVFASICDMKTGLEIETQRMSQGRFFESYGFVRLKFNNEGQLLVFH